MTGHREIFDCQRVRAYLESYLQGQVPPPEARAIRLHFQRCAACWERVVERDPLQIFAPLSDQEAAEESWQGFWPAVRAGIHEADAARGGFWTGLLRPSLAWTAAAALLIVAVLALTRPWTGPGGGPGGDLPVASAPSEAGEPDWAAVVPASKGPVPPTVQEVRSPTAEVLSMKVFGEGEGVTEVVLIVDAEMEL